MLSRQVPVFAATLVLVALMPTALIGWGPDGHEIVAALAQARLTQNARKGIQSLIGEASLASVANWADEVRPQRKAGAVISDVIRRASEVARRSRRRCRLRKSRDPR